MDNRKEMKDAQIRFTRPRDEILGALKASQVPISLQEIREAIDPAIDLSTIYRSLDLFEGNGLVNKVVYAETGVAMYSYNRHEHVHHLICISCGKIENIEECPLGEYEASIAKRTGFKILRHHLELVGLCRECAG